MIGDLEHRLQHNAVPVQRGLQVRGEYGVTINTTSHLFAGSAACTVQSVIKVGVQRLLFLLQLETIHLRHLPLPILRLLEVSIVQQRVMMVHKLLYHLDFHLLIMRSHLLLLVFQQMVQFN